MTSFHIPAATPAPVLARLPAETAKMIDYQERLAGPGVETRVMSLAETAAFTGQELAKWAALVKAADARAD